MLRGFIVLLVLSGCADPESTSSAPGPRSDPAYARDTDCAGCHPDAAEAWQGSHHDLAMQIATSETVLGDFDDVTFGAGESATRFFRRGDRFLLQTAGRDGRKALFEATHVFGVDPLQQLLVALPGGRLQSFPIAWDARPLDQGGQLWFDLSGDEPPAPGDPFHWTGVYQSWNHQCASCHSTAVERGFDEVSQSYSTTWAEIDVGCQACHGAGAAHVAWAQGTGGKKELPIQPGADPEGSCGPCHSRRTELVADAIPGGPLLDQFLPVVPAPPLYHADGQIREEVYVLGSFLQSRMAEAGVQCGDCHDPHRATTRDPGNGLCMGCHGDAPPSKFAAQLGKATDYDSPAHHRHAPGSEGASCVNCHMPAQVYMGVDARRDHAFRIPNPARSADLGAPDACTGCHADRGADWAAARLDEWYGPNRRENPSDVVADPDVERVRSFSQNAGQAGILRAAAIDRLAQSGQADPAVLARLAKDADPWVRVHAIRAVAHHAGPQRHEALRLALGDPVRAVRLEAARALAPAPPTTLGSDLARRDQVLAEFESLLRASADTPAAQFERAQLAEQRGDPEADTLYRAALFLDPGFEAAARRVAHRMAQRGNPEHAEPVLRKAIAANPTSARLHQDLGLLLAELGRTDQALNYLDQATALPGATPRMFFNLGLVLEQLKRMDRAEAAFEAGLRLTPTQPDLLYAMIAFQMNRGRPARALPYAEHLDGSARTEESRSLLGRVREAAARAAEQP